MKTSWLKIAGVVSLAFAAALPLGCGVEDIEQEGVQEADDGAAQQDESDVE
jgi:hypothetical protein